MTTSRHYVFQHPGDQAIPEGAHQTALEVLQGAQRQNWWYRDGQVQGEAFNRLVISFVVHARDQWWCHHRATRLATDCYYAMGLTEQDVPAPVWEPLAPHTNRGRYRVTE